MARFRFDSFELHASERRLLLSGQPCRIGSRALDVLMALLQHRDRVVGKDELLELAWPGLMVEENNLSVQISALRKLLGSEAIATVTGRGYKFSRPCQEDEDATLAPPVLATEAKAERRLLALACVELCQAPCAVPADGEPDAEDLEPAHLSLIGGSLAAFAGEWVETTDQRALLAFASAIDAVAWSLDLQERLAHAQGREGLRALPLVVSIVSEQQLSGEFRASSGLLAASQPQQGQARKIQIYVSDAIRGLVAGRLAASFVEFGQLPLGPAAAATRLWRVQRSPADPAPAPHNPRLQWNRRPTLAVLPFESGAEPEAAYFGDGITEEIITALSVHRNFFVVARTSTLRFRDPATATERAAAELGVRYVVTGSVRRLASKLRIHVALTDTEGKHILWTERFEGDDEDLFGFQDRIAAQVSAAIDPQVQRAEMARVRLKPTESFDAYDCVLRGLGQLFGTGADDFEAAGRLFRRAIELDPNYAQAHGQLARWHSLRAGDGRGEATAADRQAAELHSQRAVALDPRDAWSLAIAGHIQSFLKKRFDVALDLFEQALSSNPNCALAWARSGTTLAYMGRGEEALERVGNAMRLSPLDQHAFYFNTTNGIASIVVGRHDEAVAWLRRARRLNPAYRAPARMLIAAHALAGDLQEAGELARAFLAEEPGFRVSAFGSWYPLHEPHLGRVLQGLRAAGLPG